MVIHRPMPPNNLEHKKYIMIIDTAMIDELLSECPNVICDDIMSMSQCKKDVTPVL